MDHSHFWNLLAKKLSGEATEEEINELAELIKANPDLSYAAQNVADLWKLKPSENKASSEKAFKNLFALIENGKIPMAENVEAETDIIDNSKPKKRIGWPVLVAVVSMLFIASVIFLFNRPKASRFASATEQIQEIYTRPGTRTKLILPDSSVVWLNAGSKIIYKQPFGITDRKVTLTGEAYFDVVKNKKPFIIHTNGAQIKVLGTAFNVRSYSSEKKIETSLVHGRVEITLDHDPASKYVLKPDEKLTLNTTPTTQRTGKTNEKPSVVRSTLNHINEEITAETSWIENKLVFDDEAFEEIALRMERWYGVTIHFKNEKIKKEHFTGVFENENIWQALDAFKEVTPFTYQSLKNNVILITH